MFYTPFSQNISHIIHDLTDFDHFRSMRKSKRVSFHQEVTVKEFIKKQVDNSVESDISSPDLYRAPINHCGQDLYAPSSSDDSAMELTEIISASHNSALSDDSNMDLTDVSLPAHGELTMMINADKRDYPNDRSLLGEVTEVVPANAVSNENESSFQNLDMSLNTTTRGSYRNLDSLAKKMLPGQANNSINISHNVSSLTNESESSSVRRSVRIAKRSSEGNEPPQFKTPQINLLKNKKRGGSHSSRSKQRKNVSLVSNANSNESKSIMSVSKMPSITLLDNSGESDISLVSASDSIVERQRAEKEESCNRLVQLRQDKLAALEKNKAEIVMWEDKIKALEHKIEVDRNTHVHPYTAELMELLNI